MTLNKYMLPKLLEYYAGIKAVTPIPILPGMRSDFTPEEFDQIRLDGMDKTLAVESALVSVWLVKFRRQVEVLSAKIESILNARDLETENLNDIAHEISLQIEMHLGTDGSVTVPLAVASVPFIRRTIARVMETFKLGKTFKIQENLLLDRVRRFVLNTLGDAFNIPRFRPVLEKIIQRALQERIAGTLLKKHLATEINAALLSKSTHFSNVASVSNMLARNAASVIMMDKTGVTGYRITAVLDRRTCAFCRFQDGRIISVSQGMSAVNRLLNSTTPEEIESLIPFITHTERNYPEFTIFTRFIGVFHPGCRCYLVPIY